MPQLWPLDLKPAALFCQMLLIWLSSQYFFLQTTMALHNSALHVYRTHEAWALLPLPKSRFVDTGIWRRIGSRNEVVVLFWSWCSIPICSVLYILFSFADILTTEETDFIISIQKYNLGFNISPVELFSPTRSLKFHLFADLGRPKWYLVLVLK